MKTEDTDETYLDALMAREGCDMDKTPGFRDWVLDLMATIGERPRAGDLHSMHLGYKAGMETARIEARTALDRLAACEPVIEALLREGDGILLCGLCCESVTGLEGHAEHCPFEKTRQTLPAKVTT